MNDITNRHNADRQATLQKWLRFFVSIKAGAAIFVTLAGYMAGVIYYSSYLQAFQIDDRTFPVDNFRYWVYGAFAMYRLCIEIIAGANSHFKTTALAALCLIAYVMFMQAIFYSSPGSAALRRANAGRQVRMLWQKHHRMKSAALGGLVALASIWSAAVLVFAIASLISVPIIIGQEGARASYSDAAEGFAGGCEHPTHGFRCSRLYDQDKLVAEGFVIAASPEQIALYKEGATTILDLKGRRLVTDGLSVQAKNLTKK